MRHTKTVTNTLAVPLLSPFNAPFPRVMQITSIGDSLR